MHAYILLRTSFKFLDSTGYWTIERVLAESDVVPGLSARSSASQ